MEISVCKHSSTAIFWPNYATFGFSSVRISAISMELIDVKKIRDLKMIVVSHTPEVLINPVKVSWAQLIQSSRVLIVRGGYTVVIG